MGKHSLRFARSLSLAAVSAAALTVTPAAAATIAPSSAAAKLVSAADVQSVVDYLASKGDMVTPGKDSDGKPQLAENGNLYHVFFYDCSDAKDQCQTLQFQACYAGYAQGNVTKTNEWTRNYVKGKAYIDANNYVCLEEPVSTGLKGISYEAMDLSFNAFLWFRQNADSQFK
ncbi:MAG: hypothetical protein J7496_15635 [Novosphingobium sp.]|nr:hypothetical protein [Novosphingobium sp.]MBO9603933.1 hypothetical protein [Novosphingobium sp.]